MYKSRKVLLIAPAYNEEAKISEVVRRTPRDTVDTILVVDDGSTDRTAAVSRQHGAEVISLGKVRGVGYAIRRGYEEARCRGCDIAVVIAGNNKDAPEEITRLLDPICDGDYDFVMGSRYLAGGHYGGDMPLYRKFATRLHPALIGLMCGRRITESSNGYRALKVSVLADKRIDLDQRWLDGYQLEVYLLMKLLKLGYRSIEVPVTKFYPPRAKGNTKMRPLVDWWHMLSSIFIVGSGLDRVWARFARTNARSFRRATAPNLKLPDQRLDFVGPTSAGVWGIKHSEVFGVSHAAPRIFNIRHDATIPQLSSLKAGCGIFFYSHQDIGFANAVENGIGVGGALGKRIVVS